MSKRVRCKFFAQGVCLKGDHCEFSHDWKDPVCRFYQKGACSYGSRCRYQHVKVSQSQSSPSSSANSPLSSANPASNLTTELSASSRPFFPHTKQAGSKVSGHHDLLYNGDVGDSTSVNPAKRSICSFAASGNCTCGCLCPTCGKHCLHPFGLEEREKHIKSCEKRQKQKETLKLSRDIECCVCFERVLSKPKGNERKFGLLSECDHPFCVSCIRNWRSSSPTSGMDVNSALRACPVCRKLSYFVVPSPIWYSTKEEKQEIVDSYKAKLRSIDCKHFRFGNGLCPFGVSCFYKHTVEPGSKMWRRSLGLDTCSPSFLDMDDEADSVYSSNDDMNELRDLFEHFYVENDNDSADDGLENELSVAEAMAFLLMQPDFDFSDDDI